MMGGVIEVQSQEGKGSVFSFTARLKKTTQRDPSSTIDQTDCEGLKVIVDNDNPKVPTHKVDTEKRQAPHILVVEDNHVNQLVAEGILTKMAFKISIAENGKEALQQLEDTSFDLILMDCQMPEMDGFEATKAIRLLESWENSPRQKAVIVAMTANAMQGDREKCLAAGMDDYISKPLDQQDLVDIVEKWLKTRSIGKIAATEAKTEPGNKVGLVVFDRSALLQRIMNDEAIMEKILNAFTKNIASLQKKLADAVASKNAPEIRLHSHSVKGAAANVSALAVCQMAEIMELAAQKQELDGMETCLSILDKRIAAFKEVIS